MADGLAFNDATVARERGVIEAERVARVREQWEAIDALNTVPMLKK